MPDPTTQFDAGLCRRRRRRNGDYHEETSDPDYSINDGMPEDFYSIDLMNAYSSLGRIIGEDVDDDLVNEIFTKFCMGK